MAWRPPELGQRVAIFLDDAASGATLGYYGEFVGVPFDAPATARGTPERIRVYVPFLQRVLDVDIQNVFFCPHDNEPTPDAAPVSPLGIVRFVVVPLADNDEIKGFFRASNSEHWSFFHFLKTSRVRISYEYSAPVREACLADGLLFFEVPRALVLDRTFVLKALTDVMGGRHVWQAVDDASR
jgi:hypothetical protein